MHSNTWAEQCEFFPASPLHFLPFFPTKPRKQTLLVVAVLWKPEFGLTQTGQKKEKENIRTSQFVNVKFPKKTCSIEPLSPL